MAQIRFSFIELIYTRLEQINFLQEKLREDEGPSHHQEAVQPTCTRWIEGAAVLNCPSPFPRSDIPILVHAVAIARATGPSRLCRGWG